MKEKIYKSLLFGAIVFIAADYLALKENVTKNEAKTNILADTVFKPE